MSIFAQAYKSLYSPKDIAKFRFQGIGKTILYVFLLTLLSILPAGYYFSKSFTEGVASLSEAFHNDLPEFTIKNGELLLDSDKPIMQEHEDFTVIFDSTGEITPEYVEQEDFAVAFLKNSLVFTAGSQSQNLEYNTFGDITITDKKIQSFISDFQSSLPIVLGLFIVLMYLLASFMKFIQVTLLALIGILLKNMLGRKIRYPQLWIMSAYSITLATIFFMLMDLFTILVPSEFLVSWFVSIMVLYLAIKETPQPKSSQ